MNDPMLWFATAAIVVTVFALLRLGAENEELRNEVIELRERLKEATRGKREGQMSSFDPSVPSVFNAGPDAGATTASNPAGQNEEPS
jgi:hypothetical protein